MDKIDKLIEEATRFAKEFAKSSPARKEKLVRINLAHQLGKQSYNGVNSQKLNKRASLKNSIVQLGSAAPSEKAIDKSYKSLVKFQRANKDLSDPSIKYTTKDPYFKIPIIKGSRLDKNLPSAEPIQGKTLSMINTKIKETDKATRKIVYDRAVESLRDTNYGAAQQVISKHPVLTKLNSVFNKKFKPLKNLIDNKLENVPKEAKIENFKPSNIENTLSSIQKMFNNDSYANHKIKTIRRFDKDKLNNLDNKEFISANKPIPFLHAGGKYETELRFDRKNKYFQNKNDYLYREKLYGKRIKRIPDGIWAEILPKTYNFSDGGGTYWNRVHRTNGIGMEYMYNDYMNRAKLRGDIPVEIRGKINPGVAFSPTTGDRKTEIIIPSDANFVSRHVKEIKDPYKRNMTKKDIEDLRL